MAENPNVDGGDGRHVPLSAFDDEVPSVLVGTSSGELSATPVSELGGVPDPSEEDDGLVLTTDGGGAVWAAPSGGGGSFNINTYFELSSGSYTSSPTDTQTSAAFDNSYPADPDVITWAIGNPDSIFLTEAGLYLVEGQFEYIGPETPFNTFTGGVSAPAAVNSLIGGGAQAIYRIYNVDEEGKQVSVHFSMFLVVNGADTLPLEINFISYHDCPDPMDFRYTVRLGKIL